MCTQHYPYSWSRDLYERHGQAMERYLKVHVVPALRLKASSLVVAARAPPRLDDPNDAKTFLEELVRRWADHQLMNQWLQKFFRYLDGSYVQTHAVPKLWEAGVKCFRTCVYDAFKAEIGAALALVLAADAASAAAAAAATTATAASKTPDNGDEDLVRAVVELYVSVGGPEDESPLVAAKRSYYAKLRDRWMSALSTPEYLIKAEPALEAEHQFLANMRIPPASKAKILRTVEEEVLRKAQGELLENESSGFRALLKNEQWVDVQRAIRLFSRLDDGTKPLGDIFQMVVVELGDGISCRRQTRLESGQTTTCDDADFIEELVELHTKFTDTLETFLSSHPAFCLAFRNAFVVILNNVPGQYRSAEILSSYCDRILRVSPDRESQANVEKSLERVAMLVSFLSDKDMFAEYYRNQLADRLLNRRSACVDAEKLMISKLKMQCGMRFTSKMEGMMTDWIAGERQRLEMVGPMLRMPSGELDFRVQLLSPGFWPSYKSSAVALTKEMAMSIGVYNEWHHNLHPNRTVKWILTQGTASVQGTFGDTTYDFHVSPLQAIVLAAFSNGATFTFDELSTAMNLDKTLLRPILHSLSLGRLELISKSPPRSKIRGTDSFTANAAFTSNERRIRIPVPSTAPRTNVSAVENNRMHAVDASIVRIMKSSKTMKHQELLEEVLQQNLQFQPNPRTIKQRIEAMIDRGYLERNTVDSSVYMYLA
jgi:cullin 1